MKIKLLSCLLGLVIVTAAPLSQAQIGVSIGFNTCNYNGYYQSCAVYAPPAAVYVGGGSWGGDRHYDYHHGDRYERYDHDDHHDHHDHDRHDRHDDHGDRGDHGDHGDHHDHH